MFVYVNQSPPSPMCLPASRREPARTSARSSCGASSTSTRSGRNNICKSHSRTAPCPRSPASSKEGFTLIEVMVTLALTMIMMAMFASIFKIAGDFVTRQKGIGENDQAARILTTLLKYDLQARTMVSRSLPTDGGVLPPSTASRSGYFDYSENNPLDDTDDVLQFTINLSNLPSNNAMSSSLLRLATNLPLPWQAGTTYAANALVRPGGTTANSQPTGFVYKNDGAGFTSGATEPSWSSGTPAPECDTERQRRHMDDGPIRP